MSGRSNPSTPAPLPASTSASATGPAPGPAPGPATAQPPGLKPLPLPGTLSMSALRASSNPPSTTTSPSSPQPHVAADTSPPVDPLLPTVESPPNRTRAALEPTLHLIHQALHTTELIARETLHFSDNSLPILADHLSDFSDVLSQLDALAADPLSDLNKIWIPKPVLEAVDRGENPHQATVVAMDRTAAENQYLHGKVWAAGQFARAMEEELRNEFADEMHQVQEYLKTAPAETPPGDEQLK